MSTGGKSGLLAGGVITAVLGLSAWALLGVANARERISGLETGSAATFKAIEQRLGRIEAKLDGIDRKVADMDDVAKALGVRRWAEEERERRYGR